MLQCKILTDADLCKLVVRFGGSGISAVAWDCDDEVDERGGLAGGWACPGWGGDLNVLQCGLFTISQHINWQ